MNRLLILDQEASRYERLIKAAQLEKLSIRATSDVRVATMDFADRNIVFGEPALVAKFLPSATHLEWVQSSWSGLRPLLTPGTRRDYLLTGLKGVFGQIMAEYVLCHMLVHERRVFDRLNAQRAHRWDMRPPGTLRRKTVVVLGTGSIGSEVARFAALFGMRTVGVNRSGKQAGGFDKIVTSEHLGTVVADADYIVSILPHTPETTHLVDQRVLHSMKHDAVFINVGRSNVVDENMLADALNTGVIGGAVLDVFDEEPLPVDHPLWEARNTLITCHTSAIGIPEDIVPVFIENYLRFLRGEPLSYEVDVARGY